MNLPIEESLLLTIVYDDSLDFDQNSIACNDVVDCVDDGDDDGNQIDTHHADSSSVKIFFLFLPVF
jgi:hypothetical protein